MAEKKYYWLKMTDQFFEDKAIKKLRKIAGGDTYTIIYLKMLLTAIKQGNKMYFEGIEDDFMEELALELDEDTDNVKVTVSYLKSKGLIEVLGADEILLTQCAEMVGSETDAARRKRLQRDRQRNRAIGSDPAPALEEKPEVVVPEWNGPETVKIIVLDGNGEAANETLQKAVYNYIMSPESPLDRLAPPNTILTVSAPELVEIDYTIKSIELEDGYAQEEVLKDFKTGLAKYYKTVNSEGEVKYNWVHSVLTNTPGVDDFEELLMNGGISNIKIKLDQYPSTKSVMVKEGS